MIEDKERMLIALYSYIFGETDRLETDVHLKSKPLLNHLNVTSTDMYQYWLAEVKSEVFKEFSEKITKILKFYDT